MRAFEEELARLCAEHRPFAVLIGDLDGLKETNDRDGHAEGRADERLYRSKAERKSRAKVVDLLREASRA